jgi:predicted heme/steroid binding protein/uncharacterized membrane protein
LKSFTKNSLKEFNGENSQPMYIAFNGQVYDITNSPLWKNGNHMGIHHAGKDLTNKFVNAPHDTKVFSKFTVIGEIIDEKNHNFVSSIRKLAPHPMLVHFPIAYGLIIPVLLLLYLITGISSFEAASYYLLVFGFLSAPVCALSGFISWSMVYDRKRTIDFNRKIFLCIGLLIVVSICVAWRTINPSVFIVRDGLSYLFLVLEIFIAIFVSLLGHIGGKIVFSF